jgi:hypothetical protein
LAEKSGLLRSGFQPSSAGRPVSAQKTSHHKWLTGTRVRRNSLIGKLRVLPRCFFSNTKKLTSSILSRQLLGSVATPPGIVTRLLLIWFITPVCGQRELGAERPSLVPWRCPPLVDTRDKVLGLPCTEMSRDPCGVNRRAKLTTIRHPKLTRVKRCFSGDLGAFGSSFH